jgi:tetratricopeptide (TPR) repeat protein
VIAGIAYFVSSRSGARPPGPEAAIISTLENSRRTGDAERVRQACAGGLAGSCACRQEAAHRALDRNLHAEARAVLAGDAECEASAIGKGLVSEALARADKPDEAIAKAMDTLAADANEKFASYALAHAHYAKGDIMKAMEQAKLAVDRGRGSPAHLLLGLIAFRANDFVTAKVEFDKMLGDNPDDIDAHYNLAVLAARQDRYRDAREGYLKVLTLDPRHLDARYNLGLLTHSAGATMEAQHHLQKLEAIAEKGDSRVTNLRATLAKPGAAGPGMAQGQLDGGQ